MGGSFNPLHRGHLAVVRQAARRLRLHAVWLLVSPGNPLKPAAGMAPLRARLAAAAARADGRRLVATAIEARLGTRFSVDTARALRRLFPRCRFVWLMGADVWSQLPRWRDWNGFLRLMPVCVLPRPSYTRAALAGRASRRHAAARLPAAAAARLPGHPTPAWLVLPAREDPISATALRRDAGGPGAVTTNHDTGADR